MPSQHNSSYQRPRIFFSGHLETIYPALIRKVSCFTTPERQRITTPDGDFLDLDWWKNDSGRLIILQHGLEGRSDKPYMLGMARAFYQNGFDVLAWNFRGCSGEMNLKAEYYHSGATADLDFIVAQAAADYDDISLLGFSLGGNITLKYLGEAARSKRIRRAVAISVPLDLSSCAESLMTAKGYIYEKRFLNSLKQKIRSKAKMMPEKIQTDDLRKVNSLRDFDEYYTAPIHGFKDAADYYANCSSIFFLDGIQVPTLILNAVNDPLLTPKCLDHQLTTNLSNVLLETTSHGGHVGYAQFKKDGLFWSERRALDFCRSEF